MANDTHNPGTASSTVQDHRQKPRGVLPRQLQMWLMVGIAVVIVLIVLVQAIQSLGDRFVRRMSHR